MDLDEYLWRNRITQKRFAERIGIAQKSMNLLVYRKVTPTLSTAIKIIGAAGGHIQYEDLLKKDVTENRMEV